LVHKGYCLNRKRAFYMLKHSHIFGRSVNISFKVKFLVSQNTIFQWYMRFWFLNNALDQFWLAYKYNILRQCRQLFIVMYKAEVVHYQKGIFCKYCYKVLIWKRQYICKLRYEHTRKTFIVDTINHCLKQNQLNKVFLNKLTHLPVFSYSVEMHRSCWRYIRDCLTMLHVTIEQRCIVDIATRNKNNN